MPDSESLPATVRRVDMLERNISDQSKTLTALVEDVSELKMQSAVNGEREKARDDWRKRTEQRLDGIYRLGWWVLTTFGALVIMQLSRMLFGGVNVP